MQDSGEAFCFIAISVSLGACFVMAFYELEAWRRRRRQRAELTREAVKFVAARARASR